MSPTKSRKRQDYPDGRLLARREHLEKAVQQMKTVRLILRFAGRPFSTWRTIELSLMPYHAILRKASENLLRLIECEGDGVTELFDEKDFGNAAPLRDEILQSNHCRRRRNFEKKSQLENNDPEKENEPDEYRTLKNKINFTAIFTVEQAYPNEVSPNGKKSKKK